MPPCQTKQKSVSGVRHKRNVTGALDCHCELTLMEGACACDSAGQNLGSLRYISSESVYVLVVNFLDVFHTEIANLLATGAKSPSSPLL